MSFGVILVNLSVAAEGTGVQHVLDTLFSIRIEGVEGFSLMLFKLFLSPIFALYKL